MSTRLTPVGVIVKWLLAPALLVAVGYFAVGPRVGNGILGKVPGIDKVLPGSTRTSSSEPSNGETKPPDVDVTVQPAQVASTTPEHRRRRRRRKHHVVKPVAAAPAQTDSPPQAQPTDEGSSGGISSPPSAGG